MLPRPGPPRPPDSRGISPPPGRRFCLVTEAECFAHAKLDAEEPRAAAVVAAPPPLSVTSPHAGHPSYPQTHAGPGVHSTLCPFDNLEAVTDPVGDAPLEVIDLLKTVSHHNFSSP